MTIAAAMATVSMKVAFALAYTVLTPVLYGIIRVTPAGGGAFPVQAILDSVYSMLLGGGILILVTVLRAAASGVDIAQQNALARYAHAIDSGWTSGTNGIWANDWVIVPVDTASWIAPASYIGLICAAMFLSLPLILDKMSADVSMTS